MNTCLLTGVFVDNAGSVRRRNKAEVIIEFSSTTVGKWKRGITWTTGGRRRSKEEFRETGI